MRGHKKSPAGGQALRGGHGEIPHAGKTSIAQIDADDKGAVQ